MDSLTEQVCSLREQLHSIIDNKAFAELAKETEDGKKDLVFSEKGQPNSSVAIIDVPDNIVVIKSDRFLPMLLDNPSALDRGGIYRGPSFFKQGSGTGKRADYILLDEKGKRIVFLELSVGVKTGKEVRFQLVGAHAVLDYIRRVGAHFFGLDFEEFVGNDYTCRFVGALKTSYSIRKRNTKFQSQVNGTGVSEKDFKRFSGYSRIYYREFFESSIS